MLLQLGDHAGDVVPNGLVAVHQLGIGVAQHRARKAPLRGQGEEDRPAANEWLVVGLDTRGCERQYLRQQLSLAARPLEEGRRRTIVHSRFLRSVNRRRRARETAHGERQSRNTMHSASLNLYLLFCCFLFPRAIFVFKVFPH